MSIEERTEFLVRCDNCGFSPGDWEDDEMIALKRAKRHGIQPVGKSLLCTNCRAELPPSVDELFRQRWAMNHDELRILLAGDDRERRQLVTDRPILRFALDDIAWARLRAAR